MPLQQSQKIPARKAIIWILLSLLLFSGSAAGVTYYYLSYLEAQSKDSRYNIVAIVQYCPQNEPIKTSILVELLQLSIDEPSNLYRYDLEASRQKLMACPIIKMAEIKKIKPGTLYIEYLYRKPVAYLSDFTNTAIDEEGVLIPFKPFYTPKNIPELFVGIDDAPSGQIWGTRIGGAKSRLALLFLGLCNEYFNFEGCTVRSIDISKAFDASCGQREIVISLDERVETSSIITSRRLLRITVEHFPQQLANYLVMRQSLNAELRNHDFVTSLSPNLIIDMRIPKLAFIKYVE